MLELGRALVDFFKALLSGDETRVDFANVGGACSFGVLFLITGFAIVREPSAFVANFAVNVGAFGGACGVLITGVGAGRRFRDGARRDDPAPGGQQ